MSDSIVGHEQEALDQLKQGLAAGRMRIEFGIALDLKAGTSYPSAQVYIEEAYTTRQGNHRTRWIKAGPMMVPTDDDPTRANLLTMFAGLLR